MDAPMIARLIAEHYDDGRHALYEALTTANQQQEEES